MKTNKKSLSITPLCHYCFTALPEQRNGRPKRFCSSRCRQAHYRLAKSGFVRQRHSLALRKMNGAGLGEQS